jgi:hypothetical protein
VDLKYLIVDLKKKLLELCKSCAKVVQETLLIFETEFEEKNKLKGMLN